MPTRSPSPDPALPTALSQALHPMAWKHPRASGLRQRRIGGEEPRARGASSLAAAAVGNAKDQRHRRRPPEKRTCDRRRNCHTTPRCGAPSRVRPLGRRRDPYHGARTRARSCLEGARGGDTGAEGWKQSVTTLGLSDAGNDMRDRVGPGAPDEYLGCRALHTWHSQKVTHSVCTPMGAHVRCVLWQWVWGGQPMAPSFDRLRQWRRLPPALHLGRCRGMQRHLWRHRLLRRLVHRLRLLLRCRLLRLHGGGRGRLEAAGCAHRPGAGVVDPWHRPTGLPGLRLELLAPSEEVGLAMPTPHEREGPTPPRSKDRHARHAALARGQQRDAPRRCTGYIV